MHVARRSPSASMADGEPSGEKRKEECTTHCRCVASRSALSRDQTAESIGPLAPAQAMRIREVLSTRALLLSLRREAHWPRGNASLGACYRGFEGRLDRAGGAEACRELLAQLPAGLTPCPRGRGRVMR